MKTSLCLFSTLLVVMLSISCNAQTIKKENSNVTSSTVEAYYFHYSSRCITCKTVESEAKTNIETLYGGKIPFQSVNLEEAEGKALAEKLQVSGQTLLIVKGNTKINLTNDGFMYARSNPDKFKSIIKEKVDPLVK